MEVLHCDSPHSAAFVLQSKEIGLQMHEELLKVTNELYTVSRELPLPSLPGLGCSKVPAGLGGLCSSCLC